MKVISEYEIDETAHALRPWLLSLLRDPDLIVEVKFEKKDGTERVMNCTLVPSRISEEHTPKGTGREVPDDVIRVFDVEKDGWRTITLANVKQVTTHHAGVL